MKNRKAFLGAVSASSALLLLARAASAEAPAPSAAPAGGAETPGSPAPKAKASPTPPSVAALAVAATMRRFDAKLSDAEIESIARDLDGNFKAGARLNPRTRRLKNSEEPVTVFRVTPE